MDTNFPPNAAIFPIDHEVVREVEGYSPIVFEEKPSLDFRTQFLAHTKRTGNPETFAGLYLGKIQKGEPFRLLCDFDVSREKRPDDEVPCPICWQPSQFMHGWLAWFHERGWVACIGPTCADRLQEALDEFQKTEELHLIDNELQRLLPLTVAWRSELQLAKAAAEKIDALKSDFNKFGRVCKTPLKPVYKQGGELSADIDGRKQVFGRLAGGDILEGRSVFSQPIDKALSLAVKHACADDDQSVTRRVLELSARGLSKSTRDELREIKKLYMAAVSHMNAYKSFFEPRNLNAVAKWAKFLGINAFNMSVTATTMKTTLNLEGQRIEIFASAWSFPAELSEA